MGGGGSKPSSPPPPPPPAPYVPPAPKKFKRGSPPTDMSLKISKSADCKGCVFGIDVGVSSSTVVLSRDILGKIPVASVSVSDKWVWDDRVGFGEDGVPKLLQSSADIAAQCDGIGCRYLRADPTTWGTTFGNAKINSQGYIDGLNNNDLQKFFNLDLTAWRADHQLTSLKKTSGKKVRMWNPSDNSDDADGSQAINYENHGALTKLFLKTTLPFNVTFAPDSASIPVMSVFQPFPLRVDSYAEQGKQYDACFQIGEFHSDKVPGTSIVILVPLKVSSNPGAGGTFVNAFASKIPNILGQQPDPLLGYPDVPAQTGADWNVSKMVDTSRAYYTWKGSDGTRVVVMAEPVLISEGDMSNIQRLPLTPPEDVIHEIPSNVQYKAAPPVDTEGKPVPCPNEVAAAMTSAVVQPPVAANKPAVNTDLWLQVILGIVGTLAIIIGVWFGIKLASGPVGEMLKKLGDFLGGQLAGGYMMAERAGIGAIDLGTRARKGAIDIGNRGAQGTVDIGRRTRRNLANVLGVGQNRAVPPPRTPEQVVQTEPAPNTPAAIADISPKFIPEPTGDFEMKNPMFKDRADFKSRHRTQRNRTPAEIADISPKFIPDVTGDFEMKNPMYLHKSDFKNRHRTRRSYPNATPRPPREFTESLLGYPSSEQRPTPEQPVTAAEQNRQAQPAGTGLLDLGLPETPSVADVATATEPFPDAPPRRSDVAPHRRGVTIRSVQPPPLPTVAEVATATEPFPDGPSANYPAIEALLRDQKKSPQEKALQLRIAQQRALTKKFSKKTEELKRALATPIAQAVEPFPDAPAPPAPRRRNIARETDDDLIPPPPIPAAPTAATRFMRELDEAAPVDPLSLGEHSTLENLSRTEETAEERIARRARETALPRPPGMPTAPRRTSTDTGLFGSPAARAAMGVRERSERGAYGQNATRFDGGKKRKNRLKTGRRV